MPQDAPPTVIDDITVTGQRRTNPTQPFPERPEPPTGPVDPDTPSIDDETGLIDPCARPETALDWNADAAAAEAAKEFARLAAARRPSEDLEHEGMGSLPLPPR